MYQNLGVYRTGRCQIKIYNSIFIISSICHLFQGLKAYSDWPTFPQLYVDGELVGGLDIIKEMVESG